MIVFPLYDSDLIPIVMRNGESGYQGKANMHHEDTKDTKKNKRTAKTPSTPSQKLELYGWMFPKIADTAAPYP